jgi:hypothetical protein
MKLPQKLIEDSAPGSRSVGPLADAEAPSKRYVALRRAEVSAPPYRRWSSIAAKRLGFEVATLAFAGVVAGLAMLGIVWVRVTTFKGVHQP